MVEIAGEVNLGAVLALERLRELANLADIRGFAVGSETGCAGDYELGVGVNVQDSFIRAQELQYAFLGIETSDEENRPGFADFFLRKKQL